MTSHQIAIAKAAFSAGLLRPDPSSVPRDDIAAFHSHLERALSHCSPANIQTCKAWLLNFVLSSSNRVGGLAKYLVALAESFDEAPAGAKPKPSLKRRRLHILYLLNDLLHHSKYHLDSTAIFSTVSGSLQPFMIDLLGHAAAYDQHKHPRHHRRLNDLLDIWSEHGYFGPDLLHRLREVVKHSASTGGAPSSNDVLASEADAAKKLPGKDAPFIMPSTHGDPSTPYYDLPAGNLIPHIIPNSTIPLHADSIKPLQFLAGPADESLVQALKGFLKDVDLIYGNEELVKDNGNIDIDELGQRIVRDEITGDILDGETYYGWSRAFCQQMKKRGPEGTRSRSRSRSRSRIEYPDRGASLRQVDVRLGSDRRPEAVPADWLAAKAHIQRVKHHHLSSLNSLISPLPTKLHMLTPPPAYPHSQYAPLGTNVPPPPPQYPGWPPAPPPQFPNMAFPPPGSGINPPAFPPSFPGHSMPVPPGSPLPPGQYHFPPPHPGGQQGAPWGPPGGRSWR
ncbi:uncharacterized protein N7477_007671 [Penicillium maclennaniae]|uniref:uncharacterized protein n=1 Tax=Penicillium maclennaniae TaxID=1343394 RepID=UPI00254204BD|nr:uncharacterized protein N7477_007671 [Penicillium maclennaniae]KAJ5665223.1 hypothetical protein N7477_007671 [Penicillium maclennaniae]